MGLCNLPLWVQYGSGGTNSRRFHVVGQKALFFLLLMCCVGIKVLIKCSKLVFYDLRARLLIGINMFNQVWRVKDVGGVRNEEETIKNIRV